MPTPLNVKAKNITYIQVSCNLPLHSLTPLFTLVQKVLGYMPLQVRSICPSIMKMP